MHSKSDNIEIMTHYKADEVIEELFQSLFSTYEIGLETSMKGSSFVFYCATSLYYKCHKINLDRGGSYIDSPKWIKYKRAKINPINKNHNKCFQYTTTVTLNHAQIEKKITKNIEN